MHNEKVTALEAMTTIPGLGDLDISVEAIPDNAEFEVLTTGFEAALALDFDALASNSYPPSETCAPSVSNLSSKSSTSKTEHVTIRIPGPILEAYRVRAHNTGTKYQTLIVQTLKAAAIGW